MANWFGNSTSLFKGRAPETPQPFEIDCECGQRHTGLRRQQHQRIICRSCGTALFILPKDVYPASTESIPSSSAKPWSDEADDAALVADVDESEVAEAAPAKRKSIAKTSSQPAPKKAVEAPKSQPQPAVSPPPKRERKKRSKPQGPFWTPLRVVAIAMVGIVVATMFAVVRAQRIEDARRQLAEAVEQFNTAITTNDWAQARNSINQIVKSLEILGRDDVSARRHRQFHREIAAMNDLARSSLFDILEESDANQARDPDDWGATFASQHAGHWLVLELPARRGDLIEPPGRNRNRRPIGDESSSTPRYHYEFDFPVSVGPNSRAVEIELGIAAFDRLAWPKQGRSVVVAAQLKDLRLSTDGTRWIMTFDPENSFLWANIETYEGLGFNFAEWNPRDRILELLNEQAIALGIQEAATGNATPAETELAAQVGDDE